MQRKTARNADIRRRARIGESYPSIAARYGITRQRVRQIVEDGLRKQRQRALGGDAA